MLKRLYTVLSWLGVGFYAEIARADKAAHEHHGSGYHSLGYS
jgi:hypothetical protein